VREISNILDWIKIRISCKTEDLIRCGIRIYSRSKYVCCRRCQSINKLVQGEDSYPVGTARAIQVDGGVIILSRVEMIKYNYLQCPDCGYEVSNTRRYY